MNENVNCYCLYISIDISGMQVKRVFTMRYFGKKKVVQTPPMLVPDYGIVHSLM